MNIGAMTAGIRSPSRRHRLLGTAVLATIAAIGPFVAQPQAQAQTQATIYRCHSLDGRLLFQDKPCDQVASTLEARKGSAGEIIPNAPPAPETDGPPLTERYEHYLDRLAAQQAREAASQSRSSTSSAAPRYSADFTDSSSTYSGYEEGYYPYPVYPYRYPQHPVTNGGTPATPYNAGNGMVPPPSQTPLPSIMLEPSLTPPKPPPRSAGRIVGRDPNR
jgi:hypothetical protein